MRNSTLLLGLLAWALAFPSEAREYGDLVYSRAGNRELCLDLEVPDSVPAPFPLVVMVHGGSWNSGDRREFTSPELVENGFAVATIDYRLAPEFCFPCNIQDVKAAVRFLRAHAGQYGLDPSRVGAWGSSAGGHLVSLLGLSGLSSGWDVGEHLDQSSQVQAVVDWFGPTHFQGLESAPQSSRDIVVRAFGSDSLAWRQGSPLFLVHAGAPPFLIMHGKADRLVPLEQSQVFHDSLTRAGVSSQLVVVESAGHGFRERQRELRQTVVDFFLQRLVQKSPQRSPQ